MASVGRIVVTNYRKNLSALAVEAKTALIFWRVLCVRNPPVEQMNDGPQGEQEGPNPHGYTPQSRKRPSDPHKKKANNDVGIKLIIVHWPGKLPIPPAQGNPAIDFVVHEERHRSDSRPDVCPSHVQQLIIWKRK